MGACRAGSLGTRGGPGSSRRGLSTPTCSAAPVSSCSTPRRWSSVHPEGHVRAFRRVLYASGLLAAVEGGRRAAIDLAKLTRAELTSSTSSAQRSCTSARVTYCLGCTTRCSPISRAKPRSGSIGCAPQRGRPVSTRKVCSWKAVLPTESSAWPGLGARTSSSWEATDTRGWPPEPRERRVSRRRDRPVPGPHGPREARTLTRTRERRRSVPSLRLPHPVGSSEP
jgi:hypothetical protein